MKAEPQSTTPAMPPARVVNRRLWLRRVLLATLPVAVLALGYVALCLWFMAHQREYQYSPGGTRATPAQAGAVSFAAVTIAADDGARLDGWWLPPALRGGVVLYLHGTPGTLADAVWRLRQLQKSRLGIMAIDWRGYGRSTGTPSEAGLLADARAAFDYIQTAAPGSRIAIFGESLGTAPAVALAWQRPVAGLLLNAPFASVRRLYELRGPPLPYRWLMSDPFDSEALIGGVRVPILILHGTADPAVPLSEARRLFDKASEPKEMIVIDGAGHLDAWEGGGEARALAALAAWTEPDPAR